MIGFHFSIFLFSSQNCPPEIEGQPQQYLQFEQLPETGHLQVRKVSRKIPLGRLAGWRAQGAPLKPESGWRPPACVGQDPGAKLSHLCD